MTRVSKGQLHRELPNASLKEADEAASLVRTWDDQRLREFAEWILENTEERSSEWADEFAGKMVEEKEADANLVEKGFASAFGDGDDGGEGEGA